MKTLLTYIFALAAILLAVSLPGQSDPSKAGHVDNGSFILKIDLNWNDEQKQQFAELYDLDSLITASIFSGDLAYIMDSTGWSIISAGQRFMEISKKIGEVSDAAFWEDNIILADLDWPSKVGGSPAVWASWGVNDFTDEHAFGFSAGKACFFLPGYSTARRVFLSGSFNDWSTMQQPMVQSDSGWTACISLAPGKHLYKYIVDGRWMPDPNNKLKERDGHHGYNSYLFVYNYIFRLDGYKDARRVVVSGSFNNWNTKELRMQQTPGGWILPLFLREGTHAYKFIVDGDWITDPANPTVRPDGHGNFNSFLGIGDTLLFRLDGHQEAKEVMLAGEFNGWTPGELYMEKRNNGWELPYVLAAGNYEYKFIVDGRWITDPGNPYTSGTGDFVNSLVSFKPNHAFVLQGHTDAEEVIVTGSFNGWIHHGYRMKKEEGRWIMPLHLRPGKYTYKFVVDGEWILDPGNPLWEENEFGTGNSVLWMEGDQ